MLLPAEPNPRESDVKLAWEVVAKIHPLPDILRRWSLSYEDFKKKLRDPLFRSIITETKKLWNSELNTKERIRVKSQLLVEDSMLEIYQIVCDKEKSPQARVDAFEKLMKLGDLSEKDKTQAGAGERVTININLGNPDQPIKIVGEKT